MVDDLHKHGNFDDLEHGQGGRSSDPTANYEFMYNVTRNTDGSYSLILGAAAAKNVEFSSNKSDIKPGNEIDIKKAGNGLNGGYDYVGSVTTSEGGTGYIVYNAANQQYYMLTNTKFNFGGDANHSLGHADSSGAGSEMPVCFMAGTQILTPAGEITVETLKAGDLVLTSDGQSVPVRWIGRQTVARLFADELSYPVRIRAGALDDNVPHRDLLVSHEHALLVDGVLVQAGALINGTSIVREFDVPNVFVYYHVEVEDHSLILAERTPAETFVDNVDRVRFDNWQEYQALYPNGKPIEEMPYPRAKAYRQVPVNLRDRLAERARTMSTAPDLVAA
jgi:Hint domain